MAGVLTMRARLVAVLVVACGLHEAVDRAVADLAAVLDPVRDGLRKWNPTRMRESPFSAAACEKLEYLRTASSCSPHWLPAGSVVLQVLKRM